MDSGERENGESGMENSDYSLFSIPENIVIFLSFVVVINSKNTHHPGEIRKN